MEGFPGGPFSGPSLARAQRIIDLASDYVRRAADVTARHDYHDQTFAVFINQLTTDLEATLSRFAPYARMINDVYAQPDPPPAGTPALRLLPPVEGVA